MPGLVSHTFLERERDQKAREFGSTFLWILLLFHRWKGGQSVRTTRSPMIDEQIHQSMFFHITSIP